MDSLPVPPGGDQDRGGSLMAMFWTEVPIAIIAVALRIYSRYKIKATGLDDWIMIVTLILYIPLAIAVTFMVHHGGARHLYYLNPAQVEYVTKVDWISQPFNIMSLATGKISVALLLLRLLGPSTSWQRWFLYISIFLTFIFSSLTSIFTFVQCNPARALWEGPIKVPHAKCWNPSTQLAFSLFCGSYNAFMDLCLALLPITIVRNLNLALQKRIALGALLSLGIFASICAAIKTSKLPELTARADLTWATYDLYIWASTENLLLIVCGSIPTLKPLYDLRHEICNFSLTYFPGGNFSSGTSSKTYGSDAAQKRSRRIHLDTYPASHSHRIDSEEHSLGVFAKAMGAEARNDSRGREDDHSLLKMGHINDERGREVNSGSLSSCWLDHRSSDLR